MNIAAIPPSAIFAAGSSNAALITFLIYTLAVFGLAALSNRLMKSKSFISEYFLGSRSLGVWAFALTFAATSASGGSFTGFPSKIYTHGWVLGLWIGSYVVVPICAMGLLGKRINQVARISGAITVPDIIRDRFHSAKFGLIAVCLIVFFMSFNLVAQFKAGSEILNTLLSGVEVFDTAVGWVNGAKSNVGFLEGVDPAYLLCLVTFAVAVIVYTTYGGFHAVVWTDVMQGVVMVVGVLIMLPLAIYAVGGLRNANDRLARMTPPRLGMARIEVDAPLKEDFTMTSPWFSMPGEDGAGPRLFRINKTLSISKGQSKVEHVKFVEITTREEIDEQLERLTKAEGEEHELVVAFNRKMQALKGIPSPPESEEQKSDLRLIEANRVALLNTQQSVPFKITITLIKPYASGHGEKGRYVTGPGPVPATLPKKPGTLQIEVDQPGAEIRVLNKKSRVREVTRTASQNVELFSVEAGEHQVLVVKDGFALFSQDVTIEAGKTTRVESHLVVTQGTKHSEKTDDEKAAKPSDGFLPLSLAISFFFMWAISGAGQPSSMVRLMAFNNSQTLRRSIFTVAIYYSAIYFPLVIIFCCARILLPGMDLESDRIMPAMAIFLTENIGMGWLAGLLVAAPFAAVMSTVDSFLLMISSALVRDIYQRNINPEAQEKTVKRLSYLFTLLVGTGAMLGATNPPQFLQDIIVYTGSGLAACFLAPMIFALYWPRSNVQGCTAGMLAGFCAHLSMYFAGIFFNGSFFKPYKLMSFDPIIVGLFVSFATTYLVTRFTPPPPFHLVQKYFHKGGGQLKD